MSMDASDILADTYRAERGRLIAYLARRFRDVELAEDAVHAAVQAAQRDWPSRGVPNAPAAWLLSVSRRRCIDAVRRRQSLSTKVEDAVTSERKEAGDHVTEHGRTYIPDERLRLIYTCCHPAIDPDTRLALTLQLVVGMTAEQIGRAFLTAPATVAQRLVRSKRKIREARIPIDVPAPEQIPERTASVRRVIYLVFNEGYAPTRSDRVVHEQLCAEAISLGRLLVTLLRVQRLNRELPESLGLLSLMLLHDSRRQARISHEGAIIPLLEQDRSRWDAERVREGRSALEEAGRGPALGPYQIQAAISLQHATAVSARDTDWGAIARLYRQLEGLEASPVVRLNRLIAESYAGDPAQVLPAIEALTADRQLSQYAPVFAALGDAAERAGRIETARHAFARAAELTGNAAEQAYFRRRAGS
ncbi:MAG: hypothetical protein GVY29_02005 [Spirochaetes bacterium]|jgi:RNA polymerase sigma-70 factor (ECF subfamily)|nr:hypothetical protein [Spirochaetota bacterium]